MEDKQASALNRRLSHLESEVAGIGTKVEGLEAGFVRLVSSVDALATKVGEGKQTNWGVFFSGIGLVVVLGGLCLHPIYERLNWFSESQRRQWTVIRGHMAEDGHRPLQVKVTSLERRIRKVEDEQARRTSRVYDINSKAQ